MEGTKKGMKGRKETGMMPALFSEARAEMTWCSSIVVVGWGCGWHVFMNIAGGVVSVS